MSPVTSVSRKIIMGANWKNSSPKAPAILGPDTIANRAVSYCQELNAGLKFDPWQKTVIIFPPAPLISTVSNNVSLETAVGAQNVYKEGAFTGEVYPELLKSLGATWALVGHSERIQVFGESDELINERLQTALSGGLKAILCLGETVSQWEQGETEQVISSQMARRLIGINNILGKPEDLVIAYEPIWAIGTGRAARPELANEVHKHIYADLGMILGGQAADRISVMYGGSVKPDSIASYMAQPYIFGALVGGASLSAQDFTKIVMFEGK